MVFFLSEIFVQVNCKLSFSTHKIGSDGPVLLQKDHRTRISFRTGTTRQPPLTTPDNSSVFF